uniref:Uncharacterized protein n=1 Tax=Tanacetum cinerariifolium TaxID=118510 RepID=A0A699JXG6_TANCI|nr:hypothetical protein [Tanacetum cinerariifolium]
MTLHWSGVGAAPLMSPRHDKTSESLLYAGWIDGPYWCKDATRGRNDDLVTSGIRARLDRGGPKQNRSSCSPKKFLIVLAAQRKSNGLIQMVDDRCHSSVRMTMHEVAHEMVVKECHEPNSEGSGSAWKAYINARVAGLFLLVLLEYPNGKGVGCYKMQGLMLEDKEEKERLKKKLRVSQQEKEQMKQAFRHVVDWICKQFGVEIPPCMGDGDATTPDNAHP